MKQYTFDRPDWHNYAACRGHPTEWWFPADKRPISARAKLICKNCPVNAECLEYGLNHEWYGVWGGMGTRTRVRIRKELNIALDRPDRNMH